MVIVIVRTMKKILIVEDDPDLQHIFKSVLLKAGYEIQILPDGRLLKDLIVLPDIFIFDIELPFVSGLELCREIKTDRRTSHIPVLMVSASANLLAQSKEACADDSLEKPFDASLLRRKVKELLQASKSNI
jgi:DNA-binding response OmpR family regulator